MANVELNPAQTNSAVKAIELIGYGSPLGISEGYGNSVRLVFSDLTESLRLTLNEDGSFAILELWDVEGENPLSKTYDSDWMDVSEGEFGEELKALING